MLCCLGLTHHFIDFFLGFLKKCVDLGSQGPPGLLDAMRYGSERLLHQEKRTVFDAKVLERTTSLFKLFTAGILLVCHSVTCGSAPGRRGTCYFLWTIRIDETPIRKFH